MAKKANKEKFDIYKMITDKIIAQLEQGIIPWRRPWTGVMDGAISYVSRKPYSVLNQLLLGKPGEYLTFNEIVKLGGRLKEGATSSVVTFYTSIVRTKATEETEDGDDIKVTVYKSKLVPFLRYYRVFHIDQTEGIKSKIKTEKPTVVLNPVDKAEKVIEGYLAAEPHLKFHNDKPSNRAFFCPATDEVVVPMMSQYKDVEEYYSTTFHELTHSTLMPDRCDRKDSLGTFGSETYSREELVAEIGAAMLVNACGMEADKAFKNSVAYLKGWLSHLKDDKKAIVFAAARAEKAARYIQGEREDRKEKPAEAA